MLETVLVDRSGLHMASSGRKRKYAAVLVSEEPRTCDVSRVVCLLFGDRAYSSDAAIALEGVDCFVDVLDDGWVFNADDGSLRDLVEWGCSGLLVCHGESCSNGALIVCDETILEETQV